jgi:L-alanine-DL-glutamate epimerase-like enolase superfamily enzyme
VDANHGYDVVTAIRVGRLIEPLDIEQLVVEPLERGGVIIKVPERPGLGLEVDCAVLERYAVTTGETER